MSTIATNQDTEHRPVTLYESDFYAWAIQNAQLLREGRLSEIDVANIAEELEDMGKGVKRELGNRLTLLLAHLLKMRVQRNLLDRYGNSWRATVRNQRIEIADLLEENPSLKPVLPVSFAKAYEKAVNEAIKETNLPESAFPLNCPFTLEHVLNRDYWPE